MKIRVYRMERQVLIDDYFQIGGVIVPQKYCDKCSSAIIYYDKYDNEFCAYCNAWLKAPCADKTCIYCSSRPSKPLEVRTLFDKENEN